MATDETPLPYTVEEFAALLRISKAHAYRLCAREQIPHFRLGRTVRISRAWADDYLAGRVQLRDRVGV